MDCTGRCWGCYIIPICLDYCKYPKSTLLPPPFFTSLSNIAYIPCLFCTVVPLQASWFHFYFFMVDFAKCDCSSVSLSTIMAGRLVFIHIYVLPFPIIWESIGCGLMNKAPCYCCCLMLWRTVLMVVVVYITFSQLVWSSFILLLTASNCRSTPSFLSPLFIFCDSSVMNVAAVVVCFFDMSFSSCLCEPFFLLLVSCCLLPECFLLSLLLLLVVVFIGCLLLSNCLVLFGLLLHIPPYCIICGWLYLTYLLPCQFLYSCVPS